MANQRQDLLQSIATVVSDYRQGEIPTIDPNHVDKWVSQFERFGFNAAAQIVILEQMERILKAYYISREVAQDFITKALASQKLFGDDPAATISSVKFLNIQTKGSSQSDLLRLCDSVLQEMYGIRIEDCGRTPVSYIYFDDCLYSGNRVLRDITSWLPNALSNTTLHLIFFASHTDGCKYSKRVIEQEAKSRNVAVKFWRLHEFHNSRWQPSRFDCFWAREVSGEELIDSYVQTVNERRQRSNKTLPPLFRPNNMPTQDNIFSSPASRAVIESALLKAGAYIVSLPKLPNPSMRPLGYEKVFVNRYKAERIQAIK